MAESAEFSHPERIQEADRKLAEYKDSMKRAKKTPSVQLTLENVVPVPLREGGGVAPASALPIFRVQSDLKPQPIEKSYTYREIIHFTEVFINCLAAGYRGLDRIPKNIISVQLQPFVPRLVGYDGGEEYQGQMSLITIFVSVGPLLP